MRDEGVIFVAGHYWTGDVQDSQGVSASEMTYIGSGGELNSTHLLSLYLPFVICYISYVMK